MYHSFINVIMKIFEKIPLIVLISLIITSCMGPLMEQDDGSTIELSENTPFEIKLKGLPDSPLVWKPYDYDKTVIKLLSGPDISEFNENGAAIKTFEFEFQTIASGETILEMVLIPSDETDGIPAKTFEVKVISGTMGRIEAN